METWKIIIHMKIITIYDSYCIGSGNLYCFGDIGTFV